jgi:hypothetical protein
MASVKPVKKSKRGTVKPSKPQRGAQEWLKKRKRHRKAKQATKVRPRVVEEWLERGNDFFRQAFVHKGPLKQPVRIPTLLLSPTHIRTKLNRPKMVASQSNLLFFLIGEYYDAVERDRLLINVHVLYFTFPSCIVSDAWCCSRRCCCKMRIRKYQ